MDSLQLKSAPYGAKSLARASAGIVLLLSACSDDAPLGFLAPPLRWPLVFGLFVWIWRPSLLGSVDRAIGGLTEPMALTYVFFLFVVLKSVGLRASDGDENIYFYFATRAADGAVPYRDFFFAHPPIHLAVPAIAFRFFGFSLALAKSIAPMAQGIAALFVYLSVRSASRAAALLVLPFQLMSYDILMGSSVMNGQNIMAAFLAASLFAATRSHFGLSGLLSGLALGTGLYALAWVVALAVACGGRSPRALLKFVIGAIICVGIWSVPFLISNSAEFLNGVVRYHLLKPSGLHLPLSSSPWAPLVDARLFLTGRVFLESIHNNATLYLGGAAGLGISLRQIGLTPWRNLAKAVLDGTATGLALWSTLAGILFIVQWIALNEVYDFYLVPMLVVFAIATAVAVVIAADSQMSGSGMLRALIVICLSLTSPLTLMLRGRLWPDAVKSRGQSVHYQWRDPESTLALAALGRVLFFEADRDISEPGGAWLRYIWNKSLGFSKAREIAAYVAANSAPGDTIVGASTSTPLVALLSTRRVSADEADTNFKRFESGLLTEHEFWVHVCADRVQFVLAAPGSYFTERMMDSSEVATRLFQRDRVFEDDGLRHRRSERFVLYRRRTGSEASCP